MRQYLAAYPELSPSDYPSFDEFDHDRYAPINLHPYHLLGHLMSSVDFYISGIAIFIMYVSMSPVISEDLLSKETHVSCDGLFICRDGLVSFKEWQEYLYMHELAAAQQERLAAVTATDKKKGKQGKKAKRWGSVHPVPACMLLKIDRLYSTWAWRHFSG